MSIREDRTEEIKQYWDLRREEAGLLSLSDANSSRRFQEHPIWLSVVMGLLRTPGTDRPLRRVADLGCGTGMIAEMLARLGYEVIAIDFAPTRAEQAAERLRRFPGAQVRVGDATAPPLEMGEVDAVVSRNMMWLLDDHERAIRDWLRVVGPGGRVAAIDSTRRTSRHRFPTAQRLLGLQKVTTGVAPDSPVSRDRPTVFADIASAEEASQVWRRAGADTATGVDLSWVTSARATQWSPLRRALRRDRYFAVVADVPGPDRG